MNKKWSEKKHIRVCIFMYLYLFVLEMMPMVVVYAITKIRKDLENVMLVGCECVHW